MMNQPPVNKIEVKAGCRYMLVTSVAKRARQIMRSNEDIGNEKPVSIAVEELNDDKLEIHYPEEYNRTSEY
ncbi:MAG: DNA-directed RNA polymerase subunit omega [Clostridia bacterium]|nr:DNA-directed RNA polymerase subunit omega [Clostridia bacterium]MBQ3849334.1 DNA-directed RNA polymerase subunit omega [Clostridia bacterium]MBR5714453.1 DNA-directed RNA polymerase subunit omega [Clostridia bacterium]MBR5717842.1 DNA-directed RNA polymerase subunit omega [Clostridia bacterium]